jgi:CHAT domain-containing protein
MAKKPRLLILELTSENLEGKSEGKLLYELMRVLENGDRVEYRKTLGKQVFLKTLSDADHEYIHISTHGLSGLKGTGLEIQRKKNGRFMRIHAKDLEGLWKGNNKIPKLVILSACHAGHKDLVDAFAAAGCGSIIAPIRETDWGYAAAFSVLFYKALIDHGRSPWVAFKNARLGMDAAFPKSPGRWRFYKNGVQCPSQL